jgi:putative hemolysin
MALGRDMERTIEGLDASRRAGWAKYFDAQEEIAAADRTALRHLALALSYAFRIVYHERLQSDDPLVIEAQHLIDNVESEPSGRQFAERVKALALRKT